MPRSDVAKTLKPFVALGIEVNPVSEAEAKGRCPFCEREKFYVSMETGQFQCKAGSCGVSGNHITLLEEIHSRSVLVPDDHWLVEHRGIPADVMNQWGVRVSCVTGEVIVPGYQVTGRIGQLYRYAEVKGKYILLATPRMQTAEGNPQGHAIFGYHLFDQSKSAIHICEGPWDAMVWWNALRTHKLDGDGIMVTGSEENSYISGINVLAVPGAMTFLEPWRKIVAGKSVCLLYDNDHPLNEEGKVLVAAGYKGMEHASRVMFSTVPDDRPTDVCFLKWGEEGFTLDYPSGYDIRDHLGIEREQLKTRIPDVLTRLTPIPDEWKDVPDGKKEIIEAMECTKYKTLRNQMKTAHKWFSGLDHAFTVILASIASVRFSGEQLWIKVIGPPSCGKTTLAETVSAAKKYVKPLSSFGSFYSGYKSDKEGTVDHSLINSLGDKTLVTKDGDTLLKDKNRDGILSQARDIYDGPSRKEYGNDLKRDYNNRLTWILFGTAALRAIDHSELGQRFLDVVIMEEIDDDFEEEIGRRAIFQQLKSMTVEGNCKPSSSLDPENLKAIRMTTGFIEYLKKTAASSIVEISENVPEWALELCSKYAMFVAYMRARPYNETQQESKSTRELSARLMKQLTKLMGFVTVVLGKKIVDKEVMKIVRKVTLDTSRGRTLEIGKALYDVGNRGLEASTVARYTNQETTKEVSLLKFLREIKAVELFQPREAEGAKHRYRLTPRFTKLYRLVVESKL